MPQERVHAFPYFLSEYFSYSEVKCGCGSHGNSAALSASQCL